MNEVVLALIVLSAPGFLFQVTFDLASRVRRRRSRDLFAAIGELMLLSAGISIAADLIVGLLFYNGAHPLFERFVLTPLSGEALSSEAKKISLGSALVWFGLTLAVLSASLGFMLGKFFIWPKPLFRSMRSTVEDMKAGILPPAVYVTVLSKTTVGEASLIYKGVLSGIQIGPEGQIEYVALSEVTKSAMVFGKFDRVPHTSKPFIPVNSAAPGIGGAPTDRLVIESEDIANLYFEVGAGLDRPDLLDSMVYWTLRTLRVVR